MTKGKLSPGARADPGKGACAICNKSILDGQPMLYTKTATAKDAVHIRCLAEMAINDGLIIRVERKGVPKASGTA
jgi:hypothetical protein